MRLKSLLATLAVVAMSGIATAGDLPIDSAISAIIASIDGENDCGEEWRKAWNQKAGPYCESRIEPPLFRRFLRKQNHDAFVFFHVGGCCGGSNGATYLAVLSRNSSGYAVLAYAGVGYKATPVDTSYLLVRDGWIYVRLSDHWGFSERGPFLDSYFTRWRLKDGKLITDGAVYGKAKAGFEKVVPYAR